jgi:thiol:disulfide interchange protein DsbC
LSQTPAEPPAPPAVVVAPDPFAGSGPAALNGRMSGHVALNAGDFQAITLRGSSDVYFVSGNGRYVLRGVLRDLWQDGKELVSLDEIHAAVERVDVAALVKAVDVFAPFRLGTGLKREIVFVDPFCPYCRNLLNDIVARGDDGEHQYLILPVALLGPNSTRVVRNLQCAADRDAALRALLAHSYEQPLQETPDCDIGPMQKRAIFARLLQIRGVPFLIRDDGLRQDGLPGSLAGWLRGARG